MSKELALEQLQNALLTTYMANLYFLSEVDNVLYQRIEALSQAINSGEFKENYHLEFLEESGDFDIYDKTNERYIYNKQPKKYNKTAYNSIDFTSKGSFSILDHFLFRNKKIDSVFDEVEYFCNFMYSTKLLANDMCDFVNILKNNTDDFKTKKYKRIEKFMFIGTLLGRHIPLILEKTDAKTFFVCEQNLEIFRLSLFVVDYSNLARDGRNAVFSVMDDLVDFDNKLMMFLNHKSHENHTIKYFSTNHNVKNYFDNTMTQILGQKSTVFNYYMRLENVWKYITERTNKYNILQFKHYSINTNPLKDIPVLFLAAGPSLNDNIQWIKENQDRFIIVAIAATLRTLEKHNIIPDIVTSVDPGYKYLNNRQFNEETIKLIQNSISLFSINTDTRILNRVNREKLFLYEVFKPLYSSNITYRGVSIGELTVALCLNLKFTNIYCIGLDLAINQDTGETHTSEYASSSYKDDFKDKKQKDDFKSFSFKDELIEVEGNFKEKVYTNRTFAMSITALNGNINTFKQNNQSIFNLSSHGAKFEKTTAINSKEIILGEKLDKENIKEKLDNFFKSISLSSLSQIDHSHLVEENRYLDEIQLFLKELKQKPSKSYEEFNKRIEKLSELLFNPHIECSFIHIVFKNFFDVTLQYIYYCLNEVKLKKEIKKIQDSEDMFLNKLQFLLTKYQIYLKNLL